jgi:ABC-2 type transport system ATP-binding protein
VGLAGEAHRRYRAWSRGMRQRLKLALALVADVDIVLLDEPFLGVDPPNRVALRQHIHALGHLGRTVLMSSHLLHEVETITDQVAILAHGRMLGHGRVGALLAQLGRQHPQHIRIRGLDVRRLAAALVALPAVSSVELASADELELVTSDPDAVYAELPTLVVRTGTIVRSVGSEDDNLEALFRHVTQAGVARL